MRRLAMPALVAACLGAVPATARADTPLASRYSEIAPGRCGPARREPAEEHKVVSNRCRLLGVYTAETTSYGTNVGFALAGAGTTARLRAGYAVGDKLEWRGLSGGARFEPRAAIVRLSSRDPEGQVRAALAILRIEAGHPCHAAVLDGAGADANTRARAIADGVAATFRCGVDQPVIVGPATFATREVMDRSR